MLRRRRGRSFDEARGEVETRGALEGEEDEKGKGVEKRMSCSGGGGGVEGKGGRKKGGRGRRSRGGSEKYLEGMRRSGSEGEGGREMDKEGHV